jgi:hypothetical protein
MALKVWAFFLQISHTPLSKYFCVLDDIQPFMRWRLIWEEIVISVCKLITSNKYKASFSILEVHFFLSGVCKQLSYPHTGLTKMQRLEIAVTHGSHGYDRDQFFEKFRDRDQTLVTVSHVSYWVRSFDDFFQFHQIVTNFENVYYSFNVC